MRTHAAQQLLHCFGCAQSKLLLVAAAWLLCIPASAFGARAQKNVLLVYDARADMPANVVVDQTIRRVLSAEFNIDLNIRSEYIDLPSLTKQDYSLLLPWLRRKYGSMSFDVVVAVGSTALQFVR